MGEFNVYTDDMARMVYLQRYHKNEGIRALQNRLNNLLELYAKNIEYPAKYRMFGFPALQIHSKAHHEGMIDNMCQILGQEKIILEVKQDDTKSP